MALQVADLEAVLRLNDKEYLRQMNISEQEAKKMIKEIQKAQERAERENNRLARESARVRNSSARESANVFIQEERRREREASRVAREQQRLSRETAREQQRLARETSREQERLNRRNIAEQQAMHDKNIAFAKNASLILGTLALTGMAFLGKKSIEAASSITELDNVISVTFGEDRFSAVALNADMMGKAMGRSNLQMRQMVSQFGALGKGAGFTSDKLEEMGMTLTKRAVDIGSFWNVADSEAQTALNSIYTGETETLKRFGVVMTEVNLKNFAMQQGITKLYKDMGEAERIQLRYNFVLSKTAFLQGDAERTIGSTANQFKVLKSNMTNLYATLGKELDPAFNEFLKHLNESVESLSENEELISNLASIFIGLGKIVGFVGNVFKFATDTLIKFIGLGDGVEDFVNKLGSSFKLMGLGFSDLEENSKDITKNIPTTLNESSSQFETWGGNLQDVFKGVATDSEKMKIDTAKNILGVLEAFQIMSKKMPKAKALGVIGKMARLEGNTEAQTKDILKPIKDTYNMSDTDLTKGINDLKEYVKGGATDSGWSKLITKNIIPIVNTGTGGTTGKDLETNLGLELGFEKAMEDLSNFEQREAQKLQNILDEKKKLAEEEKKILDEKIKQGQELLENDKLILVQGNIKRNFEDDASLQQLNDTYTELNNKYSDNEEILKLIDAEYENYLKNLGKEKIEKKDLSDIFNETSKITSELATLFEDDLLGAMSSLIGAGGNLATSLMSGNVLGSISSGLALINQLDSILNTSDVGEKQEESYKAFEESVNNFKKVVDGFTLGQKITFGQMKKPGDLANIISGTGNEGITFKDTLKPFIGGFERIGAILGGGKATNASLDTTALQKQLKDGGYNIDVAAITKKYAQYGEKRNWYGKKESYISGYDTAGASAEINKLIEEAWNKNKEGFAATLGLSSQDFISNMVNTFKNGGSISESVSDMFTNALIEAFFNQQAFEALNKNFSSAISDKLLEELTADGINLGIDFKGMSFEEMMTAYSEIYGASSEKLKEVLEKLGLAAGQASDQLSKVSTKNLPSGLKVVSSEFQSSNASYGQTHQTIYRIENNYSKDFSEMVATSQNQSRFNQTGNARRSY